VPDWTARGLARLAGWIVGAGGTVVLPEGPGLAQSEAFTSALDLPAAPAASLAHGAVAAPGFHVMEAPTGHWTEALSGLGATGVGLLLAHVGEHPLQGHPLIPMLQVSAVPQVLSAYGDDLDGELSTDDEAAARQALDLLVEAASRRLRPRLWERGNTDFQITRGLLGVSM
jgi:hypothetical protein